MANRNTISVNINANVDTGKMRELVKKYFTEAKYVSFDKDRFKDNGLMWHPVSPPFFDGYAKSVDYVKTPYQEFLEKAKDLEQNIYYTVCLSIGYVYNTDKILLPIFNKLEYAKEYFYNMPNDLLIDYTICAFVIEYNELLEIETIDNIDYANIFNCARVTEIDF